MLLKIMALMVMSGSLAAVAAVDSKVGLVDMQKAIEATAEGQKAKKDLDTEYGKLKKDLEKEEADIRKMGEDLEKKSAALSDEVKHKKQHDIQVRIQKYQEQVQKNQMAMQKRQGELIQPIAVKLRKLIEDVGKKEGFTLVLEKSEQLVFYSVGQMDLTDRIIKEYDSKHLN